jgi:hypothetical protein
MPPSGIKLFHAVRMARYICHLSDWGAMATINSRSPLASFPFANVFSISDGPLDNSTGRKQVIRILCFKLLTKNSRETLPVPFFLRNFYRSANLLNHYVFLILYWTGCGAGSGGSIFILPPGTGAGSINSELLIQNRVPDPAPNPYYLLKISIFNFIDYQTVPVLPIWQHIFFSLATKMFRQDPDPAESDINWSPKPGSVCQDYGSAEPDSEPEPKELFMDPHHLDCWMNIPQNLTQ